MKEVYKAITSVMLEMSKEGLSKDNKNQMQGYSFRGIDDVYNCLSPKLAKNSLCILPRVISCEQMERCTANNKTMIYTNMIVEFDLISSIDGSSHTITMAGEASDTSDKSTNKALSAALKYACLQVFFLPTEGDNDADFVTHEIVKKEPAKKPGIQKVAAPKTDTKKEASSSDYILPRQAGTISGKRLGDVSFSDIEKCLAFLEKSEKEGKKLNEIQLEMKSMFEEELKKDTQSLITTSDVPF